jgi:drug/metabolite transporter (DMT)-like permease
LVWRALKRSHRLGLLLVAVSGVAFGALAPLGRIAFEDGAGTLTVLAVRFAMAFPILLAMLWISRRPLPKGAVLRSLILLGGIGYVGQSLCFFTALSLMSASMTSLLLYLYPAIVALLAFLLLREPLTRVKLAALALAIGGSALTIGRLEGANMPGVMWGVGSAFAYAAYIVAGSRVLTRVGALEASTVVIGSVAAVYLVLALLNGPQFPATAAGWWAIVGISLISTVVAITAFLFGLEIVGPVTASTLSALEPAVTVALAALMLGERLLPVQFIGGTLILAAVLLLARAPAAELQPPPSTHNT